MGKFTSETARLAGQKSRRGPAKKDPIVHDAMEILLTEGMAKLYEKMDELNVESVAKACSDISELCYCQRPSLKYDRFTQEFKDNRSMEIGRKSKD